MAEVYRVRIVGNCSEVNGTLIRIHPHGSTTSGPPNNSTSDDDSYDHQGAMQFIIATVLVYSICGVLCTLINRMKRLRGKSHQAYLQDENVQRYLKSEKVLKLDGRRTKMMYDCEVISETVDKFEEKQKLRELEREIASGDFVQAHERNETRKKRKKKKRGTRDVGGTLGQMGLSLFYIPANDKSVTNAEEGTPITYADDGVTAADGKPEEIVDLETEQTVISDGMYYIDADDSVCEDKQNNGINPSPAEYLNVTPPPYVNRTNYV